MQGSWQKNKCIGNNILVLSLNIEPSEKGLISNGKYFTLLKASINLKTNAAKWLILSFLNVQSSQVRFRSYQITQKEKKKNEEKRRGSLFKYLGQNSSRLLILDLSRIENNSQENNPMLIIPSCIVKNIQKWDRTQTI